VFVVVVVVVVAAFVAFVDFKGRDGKCVLFIIKLQVFLLHREFCFKVLIRHSTLGLFLMG
jgi:hypothetical protein